MAFQNHWEKRGVYRKYDGAISGHDLRLAVREVEGDARFDEIRYVINDFSTVTEQSINKQDIEEIAALDYAAAFSNPYIRLAIVTDDPSIQALAELYVERNDSPYPAQIFSELDSARAWCYKNLPATAR